MSPTDPLLDALRRANPAPEGSDATHVAPPDDLFEEITMSTATTSSSPIRHPVLLAVAAAVLLVAMIAGAIVIIGDDSDGDRTETAAPTTDPSTSESPTVTLPVGPGGTGPITPGMGSCVERYSIETLENREVAFDGTVASIEGGQVTFDVHAWYQGGEGSTVTLDDNGLAGGAITSVGGDLQLVVGQRLLVAGDGGFVWACGFTQPYDEAVASSWADTFAD